jgi:hypothetical protein
MGEAEGTEKKWLIPLNNAKYTNTTSSLVLAQLFSGSMSSSLSTAWNLDRNAGSQATCFWLETLGKGSAVGAFINPLGALDAIQVEIHGSSPQDLVKMRKDM